MSRPGAAVLAVLVMGLLAGPAVAQQRTISVTGDASLSAANDTARVSFSVEGQRRTRAAALGDASRRLRAVIATLRSNGVAARDLRTGRISIRRERLRTRRGRVVRYRASSGVRAVIRPAAKVGTVVDAAVGVGALVSSGPTFFVSDAKALQRTALTSAFGDARAKAAALAAQAGLTLGRPISIRDSTFVSSDNDLPDSEAQEPQKQQAEGRAEAPTPTRPGITSVEATVYVVFEAN